jgi:hypothetical protein
MSGYVYAVTNPSIPDLVKIGRTANLEKRLESLFDSSVPTPFECVCAKKVEDPKGVESKLHSFLAEYRVNERREFFKVNLEKIKSLFGLIGSIASSDKDESRSLSVTIPEAGKIYSEHLSTLYSIVERLNIKKITLPCYQGLVTRNKNKWSMEQSFNFEVPPNYTEVDKEFIKDRGFEYFPERPTEDGNRKPYVAHKEKRVYLSQYEFAKFHNIPPDYVSDQLKSKCGWMSHEIIDHYRENKKHE